jgi:cytochrome d ubiquinol oxidase subunit II
MNTIWFLILTAMLAVYAVLDGFDLGVGSLLLALCRSEKEREQALASIGPVWNGNEVWLLAGGGAMVAAFPKVYAVGFSGFYLALILVLWLLILRGVGYEFRHFEKSPLWRGAWDVAFSIPSLLLAVLFGAAVGNVLRGVPLGPDGYFQGSFAFLLNPFALVAGVLSAVCLSLHGAAYLAMKTDGPLQDRSRKAAFGLWIGTVALTGVLVAASFFVRPDFVANFTHMPALLIVPLLAIAALIAIPVFARTKQDTRLFQATTLTIVGLLGSAAAGLFPRLLPQIGYHPESDLTIYNAAAAPHALATALIANIVGMAIVTCYTIYIFRVWKGKVEVAEH